MTKTAAAVQPPAWDLKETDLAREKVELMLHNSMSWDSCDERWWWHFVSTYSMLPIGNIP
jgi:hypothetical protein